MLRILQLNSELKHQNINMNKTHQTTHDKFIDDINYEDIIVEFEISPHIKNLLLVLDKISALTIIDLSLGGDGNIEFIDRKLTDIDVEVLRYLMQTLLSRLYLPKGCSNVKITNIYTDKAQYSISKIGESVFSSYINIKLNSDKIGNLKVCMPYTSMEPILEELVSKRISNNGDINKVVDININSNQYDIKLELCAEIGKITIKVSDLLMIEEGNVLLLNQKVNEDIDLKVGDNKVFKGKSGLIGAHKGVLINNCIKKEI